MSEPRRHHIVPEGYLKHWCPQGETVRVNARILATGKAAPIGVGSLCVQEWWLAREGEDGGRDLAIEKDLARVEGEALELIREAAMTGRFASVERLRVAYFISSLTARSYELRDVLKQQGVDVGEEYLLEHPHAEESVRWQQDRHLTGDLSLRTIFDLVVPHHAAWINSMHWALYRDPNAGLFTSDQPVVHVQGARAGTVSTSVSPVDAGAGDLDAVMVALSPSVLLVSSWRGGEDHDAGEMPDGLGNWYNAQVHRLAEHHLIEPPTSSGNVDMDAKLPPIDLSRDPERYRMALWARDETAKLDDHNGMCFVLAEDAGYRPYMVLSESPEQGQEASQPS